jgi:tetratricopeptide (TPR) repeat protein
MLLDPRGRYTIPLFSLDQDSSMRIAREFSGAGLLFFCFFLLLGTVCGQDAEWDRSIEPGDAAMAKQHYAEAETAYREALAFAEKRWKKDARLSAALFKLAESCNAQGKQEEAETLAKRSSASMDEALKSHKPANSSDEYQQLIVSTGLFDKVGDLFAGNQHHQDAEDMYEKSLKRWQEYVSRPGPKKPGNEDFFRFWIQVQQNTPEKFVGEGMKLATLYQKDGKSKEAMALYQQLATTAEKLYEPNDPRMVPSLTNIATSEFRLGDYAAAESLFKRVIDVLASSKYKNSPVMASALENYAVLLKKTGREDAAKPFLERAALIRANSTTAPH